MVENQENVAAYIMVRQHATYFFFTDNFRSRESRAIRRTGSCKYRNRWLLGWGQRLAGESLRHRFKAGSQAGLFLFEAFSAKRGSSPTVREGSRSTTQSNISWIDRLRQLISAGDEDPSLTVGQLPLLLLLSPRPTQSSPAITQHSTRNTPRRSRPTICWVDVVELRTVIPVGSEVSVRPHLCRDWSLQHSPIGQAHLQDCRLALVPWHLLEAWHDLDTNADPVIDACGVQGRVSAIETGYSTYSIPIVDHHWETGIKARRRDGDIARSPSRRPYG